MAWYEMGDEPLPEPVMTRFIDVCLTAIYFLNLLRRL